MLIFAKEANSKTEGKCNRILKNQCAPHSGEKSKTLMTEHYQRKMVNFMYKCKFKYSTAT